MNLRIKLALTLLAISIPLVFGIEYLRGRMERNTIVENLRQYVQTRFEDFGGIQECEQNPSVFGGVGSLRSRFDMRNRSVKRLSFRLRANSLWAYDIGFVSDNIAAPDFPPDLARELRSTGTYAAIWREPSEPMSDSEYMSRYFEAEMLRYTARGGRDSRRRPPPSRRSQTTREPEEVSSPLPFLEFALLTSADDSACAVVYVSGWAEESESGKAWWWLSYGLTAVLVAVALLAAGPMVRRIRLLTDDVRAAAADSYATPVPARGGDEIAKLAEAFNTAGKNIREQIDRVADRETALRQFVANTTHDVMIPLTVLQGHLTQLRTKLPGDAKDALSDVTAAADEAHYLGSILQNLSAVSKLEGADYVIREDVVRLDELVERVIQRHKPIARVRLINLEYAVPEAPTHVRGDVTLLEQAVSNVVHNAVRYNEDGGNVAVLLDVDEATRRFTLRVLDDGPGIPEDEMTKIAERRFRGERARTRNPDGNGLGLHIARDVALKHAFEFQLRPSEYGGLEVEFSGELANTPTEAAD